MKRVALKMIKISQTDDAVLLFIATGIFKMIRFYYDSLLKH